MAASITVAVVETRDEGEMSRLKLTNYDVNRIASTHENASGGLLSVLWNGPSAFDSVRCPACSTIRLMDAPRNKKTPPKRGFHLVAPTGIDPVTFRFSVERSTN